MAFTEKLKLVFSRVFSFFAPMLQSFLTAMGTVVAASALKAVTQAEASGLTGKEKAKLAYDTVVADLKEQSVNVGVDCTIRMVNQAIEAAVEKISTK